MSFKQFGRIEEMECKMKECRTIKMKIKPTLNVKITLNVNS